MGSHALDGFVRVFGARTNRSAKAIARGDRQAVAHRQPTCAVRRVCALRAEGATMYGARWRAGRRPRLIDLLSTLQGQGRFTPSAIARIARTLGLAVGMAIAVGIRLTRHPVTRKARQTRIPPSRPLAKASQ
jgi:hypothetical protein